MVIFSTFNLFERDVIYSISASLYYCFNIFFFFLIRFYRLLFFIEHEEIFENNKKLVVVVECNLLLIKLRGMSVKGNEQWEWDGVLGDQRRRRFFILDEAPHARPQGPGGTSWPITHYTTDLYTLINFKIIN